MKKEPKQKIPEKMLELDEIQTLEMFKDQYGQIYCECKSVLDHWLRTDIISLESERFKQYLILILNKNI